MGKLWNAISSEYLKKKDTEPIERLEYNRIRATIEAQCEKYLVDVDDIYRFEALPSALDATIACLENTSFQEKYEFAQETETVFAVRLKEINLMG